MSAWSNEDIIFFLESYQNETCIWNPNDVNHKDKKKVADAWSRLSELIQKPVNELKTKKEILMTTFRKHLKKKQKSIRSGAGAGDIYKPIWFAYEIMETFLLPVYTCVDTINTEGQKSQNAILEETEESENDSLLDRRDDNDTGNTSLRSISIPSQPPTSTHRSRRRTAPDYIAEQQMAAAFGQLTNVLGQRQIEHRPAKEDDDCDLYSKLLAKKLRELPNDERKIIMYEIDGLFINMIHKSSFMRYTPSPQYYSRPPSVPTYLPEPILNTQHRPSSTINSYLPPSTQTPHSEPIPNIVIQQGPAPSTKPSHSINIISDQIIRPSSSEPNIINGALLKAYEDFESFNP